MFRRCFYLLVVSAMFANAALARLPNHTRTPGATNPDVTQNNIHQTICVSGWTKTIRPCSTYTNKLKVQQIKEYRYKEKRLAEYEDDHLISLQLGGHFCRLPADSVEILRFELKNRAMWAAALKRFTYRHTVYAVPGVFQCVSTRTFTP